MKYTSSDRLIVFLIIFSYCLWKSLEKGLIWKHLNIEFITLGRYFSKEDLLQLTWHSAVLFPPVHVHLQLYGQIDQSSCKSRPLLYIQKKKILDILNILQGWQPNLILLFLSLYPWNKAQTQQFAKLSPRGPQ